MKLKVDFSTRNEYLIYDNKYFISSWIYNCLASSDSEYSEKFHNESKVKLFTFSNLFFKGASFHKDHIQLENKKATLYISFYRESFGEHFIKGMLDTPLVLGPNVFKVNKVSKIKTNTYPNSINNEFHYKCLSPVTVTKENYNGVNIYYCKPSEDLFFDGIAKNLKKKYKLINGKEYLGNIVVKPDGKTKIYPKLYSIKEGKVSGFEMGFTIKCSEPMREIILSCGLGEKNSLGFGMVDITKNGRRKQ